ncbi:hypothetical protein ACFLYO_00445 [Chloroflexota bacterium]
MEWETFIGLFQAVVLLGGTLGSIIFGPRLYKAQKARSAEKEASRRQSILADAARASDANVTALQDELAALRQQIADQHTAIEALEHWNGQQQEKITELECEKDRLQQALDDERDERKRLEKLVTELRVDKAGLAGQINAYQQMFEQLLVKTMVTPVGETSVPAVKTRAK